MLGMKLIRMWPWLRAAQTRRKAARPDAASSANHPDAAIPANFEMWGYLVSVEICGNARTSFDCLRLSINLSTAALAGLLQQLQPGLRNRAPQQFSDSYQHVWAKRRGE